MNSRAENASPLERTAPITSEIAILRTVLYADVFDFPLTVPEIHRYLIGDEATLAAVMTALETSEWLAARLTRVNGYYAAAGRVEVTARRDSRSAAVLRLWRAARFYGRVLAHLPFVRMVAVTGALAMDNAHAGYDIDYMLITAPGRVWLARAFAVVVVRLARLTGARLCPNYLLAETSLPLDRRDLFVAHELAQMVPLAGQELYAAMIQANAWTDDYLPNAAPPPRRERESAPRGVGKRAQRFGEWLLSGTSGDALENWERRRKLAKFAPQLRQSGSAAALDATQVKGHFNDYGGVTLREYEQRCQKFFSSTD